MLKIALVGRSRQTKSFVGWYLRKKHHFKYMQLTDGVKRSLYVLYHWKYKKLSWITQTRIYDELYKIDSNIWIGFFMARLKVTTMDVVVNDARYLNEIEQLKSAGFIIVRVTGESRPAHLTHNVMNSAPGTLILSDWFDSNFADKIGVDYSIHYETRDGTRKAVDQLIEKLRSLDN